MFVRSAVPAPPAGASTTVQLVSGAVQRLDLGRGPPAVMHTSTQGPKALPLQVINIPQHDVARGEVAMDYMPPEPAKVGLCRDALPLCTLWSVGG